jgi:PPOX class probable F420-dependent enzyme
MVRLVSAPTGAPLPSRRLRGEAVLADPLVRELLEARLVASLATLEPDGSVHLVAIWFALAGDVVLLATGSGSRKVSNLEQDPRATLLVHDSRPGAEVCGACLEGRAEVVRGAEAATLVAAVHAKYVEPEAEKEPEVAAFFASDDVALRLRPLSAWTWDERESGAARALRARGGALPLVPTAPR